MTGIGPTVRLLTGRMLALALLAAPALASQDTLYYRYTPALPAAQQSLQAAIDQQLRDTEYSQALALSQSLLDASEPDAAPYAMLLVNHGIIQAAVTGADNQQQGLVAIERGLALMEQTISPFARQLQKALMARGITRMALGEYAAAEDSFRHAQHIAHRHGGVYAPAQIPIVNYITVTQLKRNQGLDADREQTFNLRISERDHGPESPSLLPLLNSLGNYFANRGHAYPLTAATEARLQRDLLFKNAVRLFQRAVTIIETNYGDQDPRLLQPLRGIADARIRQVANRKQAGAALERCLAILQADPDSDLPDRVMAMVDLGDLYTLTAAGQAEAVYLEAWQLLQETPETRQLAEKLFATPTRLHPKGDQKLYLSKRPDAAGEEGSIYATVEYSVTREGKVNQLKVIEKNLSNEQLRLLKIRLRNTRFRPTITNGQLVPTAGLQLRQDYYVIEEPSADGNKEPSDDGDKETSADGGEEPSAARNKEPSAARNKEPSADGDTESDKES